MSSARSQRPRQIVDLPLPPPGATFGALIEILVGSLVAPPSAAPRTTPWSYKELDVACGARNKEGKGSREWRKNRRLPRDTEKIEHAFFGSEEADYHEWRVAIRQALDRARSAQDAQRLEKASQKSLQIAVRRQGKVPSYARTSAGPSYSCYGRDSELAAMHAAIHQHPRRVALVGCPGVGKTAIGNAYLAEHGSKYRIIGRIDASTPERCAEDILLLGHQMQCIASGSDEKVGLRSTLATIESLGAEAILFFDRATDARMLRPFLPAPHSVRVIITSTSPHWTGDAHVISVEPWSAEVAAAFLAMRLSNPELEAQAASLVSAIGGLPAALEHAVSYCLRMNCSLEAFLELYLQDPMRYLCLDGLNSAYPGSLAGAILDRIAVGNSCNPTSKSLLAVMDLLASAPIPVPVLEAAFRESGCIIEDAIAKLVDQSLIRTATIYHHGKSCRVIHADQLPRRLAIRTSEDQPKYSERALYGLLDALPQAPFEHVGQVLLTYLLSPHISFLLKSIDPTHVDDDLVPACGPLAEIGLRYAEALAAIGYPEQAIAAYRSAYDWQRDFGEPSVAAFALLGMAAPLTHLQRLPSAERMLRTALAIANANASDCASLVPAISLRLSELQLLKGRIGDATLSVQLAHDRLTKTNAPDSPECADCLEMRALVYMASGDFNAACTALEQVLDIRRRHNPPNPKSLAKTLSNLALSHAKAARFEEAMDYIAPAHDINIVMNGPGSSAIGTSWLLVATLKANTSLPRVYALLKSAIETIVRPSERYSALYLAALFAMSEDSNPVAAITYANEAMQIAATLGVEHWERSAAAIAAQAHLALGQTEQAEGIIARFALE